MRSIESSVSRKPPYEPVIVEFHAGYKGFETPRAVSWRGTMHSLEGALRRQRVLDRRKGHLFEIFEASLEGRRIRLRVYPSGLAEMRFLGSGHTD